MFQGLQDDQLKGALEAMMFVTDEPVGIITFSEMLEVEPAEVEAALKELRDDLARENRGIQLREVAGGWRLYTHPAYHELIEKYVVSWDTRRLTQASMETLAIVAYQQPITRAGVASVRGVNSDSSINSLVEKGLLREAGTADTPGNPVLYATTRVFLERFGLRTLDDLPDLEQFAPDEQTRDLIRERLSATRADVTASEEERDAVASSGEGEAFEGLSFDFDDEAEVAAAGAGADAAAVRPAANARPAAGEPSRAAQDALADAMAESLGATEKIDFDKLHFETDED